MAELQREQIRVLRLYGVGEARLKTILKEAKQQGCPNLQLMERGGEYVVAYGAALSTVSATDMLLDTWERRLGTALADCLFGTGDTTLAEAAVKALLDAGRTFTAADQCTVEALETSLRPVADAAAVYDFGNWTGRGHVNVRRLSKKYPGDRVQAAAERLLRARENAGTTYAVCYCPEEQGAPAFVLVGDEISISVQYLKPGQRPSLAMLDALRRMARDFPLTPEGEALSFRPGQPTPDPLTAQQVEQLHAQDNTELPAPEIRDNTEPLPIADLVPRVERRRPHTLRNLLLAVGLGLAVALCVGAALWFGAL